MKKFNQFNEMSMSVTLKPKKNNMYKVTGVGKKMAAHGGIKKGEKFHDRDIDGMHDSGIKVKYEKPKMKKVNERNTGVKEMPPIKMKIKPLKFKPIPGNPKYKGPANPKPPVMLNVRQKDGTYRLKGRQGNHCWRMWSGSVLTWDGGVVPCCFDKDATHTLGSIRETSFKEIWKAKNYRDFRQSILNAREEIDICKNCSEGAKVWA